jgi:sugar phosphate isomerase/epimerase
MPVRLVTIMDRTLISVEHYSDLAEHLAMARQHAVGLELQEFSDPNVLDGDWRSLLDQYEQALDGFTGLRSMHGAYIDLVSGSPDLRLVTLTRERYLHNLDIGRELGVQYIDFHANYLPLVDHPSYLPGWVERQVAFWSPMAEQAEQYGIILLLENMWEPDPAIIVRILERIQSPYLKACLDVGHAVLYSHLPLREWVRQLGDHLIYTHLHNNHGTTDEHLAFGDGVIDFPDVLNLLRAMPRPPLFSLELPTLELIRDSLPYLELAS